MASEEDKTIQDPSKESNATNDEMEFRDYNQDIELEGEIATLNIDQNSTGEHRPSTLDEPIKDTILRDLKAIATKFYYVLIPRKNNTLLRDWDLWGPLILCTLMSYLLESRSFSQSNTDGGPQFATVFSLFSIGAVGVTLNSKLLNGDISFFQSLCVLGYCVFPLCMSLIICRLLLLAPQTIALFIVRLIIVSLAFIWSTYASINFLTNVHLTNRRALAVYPIGLFYFVITWLIISTGAS